MDRGQHVETGNEKQKNFDLERASGRLFTNMCVLLRLGNVHKKKKQ